LEKLKGLSKLRVLNLKNCAVADDDLPQLQGLKNLRMLYVKGTKVTEDYATGFKKKIPGLAVFFY
jgi:hypothetical protein